MIRKIKNIGEFMDNEFKQEIQIAESLILKAEQIIEKEGSKIQDIKPVLSEKLSKLKTAIKSNDIDMIRTSMNALQAPIRELSARVYESVQQKPSPTECDSCQVNFELPPDMMNPNLGSKKMKKKKKMKKWWM